MLSDIAQESVIRYLVNSEFNRAVLMLKDDSSLVFEHTSRTNRWARASSEGTTADRICRSLQGFRLNAKHLQLFFEDGSNVEFGVPSGHREDTDSNGTR